MDFFKKFCSIHEPQYSEDLLHLCGIRHEDRLYRSEYVECLHNEKFSVVLSKNSNRILKQMLEVI